MSAYHTDSCTPSIQCVSRSAYRFPKSKFISNIFLEACACDANLHTLRKIRDHFISYEREFKLFALLTPLQKLSEGSGEA